MRTYHLFLFGVLGLSLVACKKEKITYLLTPEVNESQYGVIKGKVKGHTFGDSTSFDFSYKHVYDHYWGESWWEYSDEDLANDSINIWIEFLAQDSSSFHSYIWIKNWDHKVAERKDIDIEVYLDTYQPFGQKTLYYRQLAGKEDIEINDIDFNKDKGRFSIELTAQIQEGDINGTTENPGTMTMSFSGVVFSADVDF